MTTNVDRRLGRVLVVYDGAAWFLRQVRVVIHDWEKDEKVYKCDRALGGPYGTPHLALAALRRALRGDPGSLTQEKLLDGGPDAHRKALYDLAYDWLSERANPEAQNGLGVCADTRFAEDLTKLLLVVDAARMRNGPG